VLPLKRLKSSTSTCVAAASGSKQRMRWLVVRTISEVRRERHVAAFADAAMLSAEAQAAKPKAKQNHANNSPTNHILSHVAAKPKESVSVAGISQHIQTPRSLE